MTQPVHGQLHTEVMGPSEAPPMLFMHPNPLDSSCWIYQMAHFSTWYRTVAVDLPGYGRSPSADEDVTMPDIAAACWEALDRVARGSAVLVGCSVGAYVAQHMYHLRPERTRAVVLTGISYKPTKTFVPPRVASYKAEGLEYRRTYAAEVLSPAFRESPLAQWIIQLIMERNDTADLDTIIAMFEALGVPDPEWLQLDLHAPTLIITGSEDRSHAGAFDLRDRIPDCEIRTLEGAGHACQLEKPWEYDAYLLDFLRRRIGGPPSAD